MNAADRIAMWTSFCRGCKAGGDNVATINGVAYSFDARPRVQKNGALIGRFYAQPRGASPHDIGQFKISASGQVLEIPTELAGSPFDPAEQGQAVTVEELAEEVAALSPEDRAAFDALPSTPEPDDNCTGTYP